MLRFFYLSLSLLFSLSCLGQSGFQVQPSKLYFHEQEGALMPARLLVRNPSQIRMVVRANCADWQRDSVGNKNYFAPGKLSTSCCPYLLVQPETVELQPGEEKEMIVTLRPPKSATTSLHHGMLFLTQANEHELAAAQKVTAAVVFRMQIGVHLYHIPAATRNRSLVIDTLAIAKPAEANGNQPIRIRVKNAGDLNAESSLLVELTNLETAQETKLSPVDINTLPGDRIWVTATPKTRLPKGRYLVVAILDSGPDIPLQVAELETNLP